VLRVIAVCLVPLMSATHALAADKLRVGKGGVGLPFSTVEIGQQAKIWEKFGLEIEVVQMVGDSQQEKALAAGDIDLALASGPTMGFRLKGVPKIAVAAMAGAPYSFVLVVRPDNSIKTVADLKGRNGGVTSAGSLTDWLLHEVARQQGWGPDGIKSLSLGSTRTRLAAMKNKEIDTMVTTTAAAYDFEENNQAKILVSFGDIVHDFLTHVITAREKVVAERPDLVERFLKGWFTTVAYMKAHPEIGSKVAAEVLQVSLTAARKAYDADMKMMSDDGVFTESALDVIRKSLPEFGILDRVPEAKELYTDRFVPVKL
jgi:NitT/TauT family transport system substrate-binding protein